MIAYTRFGISPVLVVAALVALLGTGSLRAGEAGAGRDSPDQRIARLEQAAASQVDLVKRVEALERSAKEHDAAIAALSAQLAAVSANVSALSLQGTVSGRGIPSLEMNQLLSRLDRMESQLSQMRMDIDGVSLDVQRLQVDR